MKIVMYHYIRKFNRRLPFFKNFLDKKEFIKQINYFQKNRGIIKKINEIENNKDKYLLTFDDGLKEQIFAAKVLAKKGLTGIFFIPSLPFLENKFLDVHKIQILLGKIGPNKIIKYLNKNALYKNSIKNIRKSHIKKFKKAYSYNKDQKLNILFKKNMNYLIESKNRGKILDEMFNKFKVKESVDKYYMNLSDLIYLKRLGMTIGCHSHSHNILSKMSKKNQMSEISKSKKFLERKIRQKIDFFCFPYGRKYSYNKETIKILKKNKFKYAFSVESRDVSFLDLNKKYELPRYDTNFFKKNY